MRSTIEINEEIQKKHNQIKSNHIISSIPIQSYAQEERRRKMKKNDRKIIIIIIIL